MRWVAIAVAAAWLVSATMVGAQVPDPQPARHPDPLLLVFPQQVMGDLRGNGIMDIVRVGPHDSRGRVRSVQVLLGKGDGTFALPVTYGTVYFPVGIRLMDTRGRGLLDILVFTGNGSARALVNNGDGTFSGYPRVVPAPAPARH